MSKKRIDHDGARVYEMLNPKPKELLQKRRTLVRQGEIVMWSNNEKILKKRFLFLFEDVLLITKKEFTNNYWLKIFITLKPSIKAGLFKNSKYKIPNVEFRIYCATSTFALFGKNKEEAETWVRDINKGCGHDQKTEEPKKEEIQKKEISKEEYNDIQKYNKTGEQKNVQTKLNIDESLIPNQFFSTENDNPPSYQESVQQHPSQNTINFFQQQPPSYQQQPIQQQSPQQQPIQQQPNFLFSGNTNLFGNFPQQQQPIQQQPIQQQPIQQQPIQQQPIQQQPNQDIQLNLFLPQQQQPIQQQPIQQQPIQQQPQTIPSIVTFEQNGLKIVFDFPPKENGIILLTMRSGNANNVPITNFSLKMAAPSYVDLKMAVASGDVLGPQNSVLVEQRVKLLNTLQGIKPLILKLKIEGLYGNETIDIIHTVSNLPDL